MQKVGVLDECGASQLQIILEGVGAVRETGR